MFTRAFGPPANVPRDVLTHLTYYWFTRFNNFGGYSITMTLDLEIVLIVSALAGAGLNVIRGAARSTEDFSPRLAVGAGITAGIAALATIAIFDVSTIGGVTQAVVLGLLAGFSADQAINKLKSK